VLITFFAQKITIYVTLKLECETDIFFEFQKNEMKKCHFIHFGKARSIFSGKIVKIT